MTSLLILVAVAAYAVGWWQHAQHLVDEAERAVERLGPFGPPRSHVHTIRQTQLFDQEHT